MKRIFFILVAAVITANVNAEVLVVYFSATGHTKDAAEQIAAELETQGQEVALWRIEPYEPYTEADLDWRNKESRSSIEMRDPDARPTIKQCTNIMPYDTIYLGYPIWWGICPRIIDSWLENNLPQLEAKTLFPFATSGSSSIDQSVEYLRTTYPALNWKSGRLIR